MQTFELSSFSQLEYQTKFINVDPEELEFLKNACPSTRHKIQIYGKMLPIPRFQQAYGKSYEYSGSTSHSKPMPQLIRNIIEKLGYDYNMLSRKLV